MDLYRIYMCAYVHACIYVRQYQAYNKGSDTGRNQEIRAFCKDGCFSNSARALPINEFVTTAVLVQISEISGGF